jgi:hypothetical protein
MKPFPRPAPEKPRRELPTWFRVTMVYCATSKAAEPGYGHGDSCLSLPEHRGPGSRMVRGRWVRGQRDLSVGHLLSLQAGPHGQSEDREGNGRPTETAPNGWGLGLWSQCWGLGPFPDSAPKSKRQMDSNPIYPPPSPAGGSGMHRTRFRKRKKKNPTEKNFFQQTL